VRNATRGNATRRINPNLLVELGVGQGQFHGLLNFLFEGKGWERRRKGVRYATRRNATRRINPNLLVELEVGQGQFHDSFSFLFERKGRDRVLNNRKES